MPAERHGESAVVGLVAGIATSLVGLAGLGWGLSAVAHGTRTLRIGWLLPLVGVDLRLDSLGSLFVTLTGAVAIPVGLFTIGYARREHMTWFPLIVLPLFVASMLLVPAAGSVTTFLLAWELMAVASLALVLSEHRRAAVRVAGLFYAVMTQLGFVTILLALVVLSAAAGADRFTDVAAHASAVSGGPRTAVFLLTVVGFGSKAGLLPLHAWLPRAHPEAPSPVSALMSAAMVNMGIYGIVRVDLVVLGPGPRWWGLLLVIAGAVSAVYGVLQASVATDLKRLLAYSTTENMGLITTALGAGMLLHASGASPVATIAVCAALLHLFGHAAFKTLGFLAAGSVLAATGLRDLDMLGGLARRMPFTTVAFGIAALGASGLPLGAGFVSEWLLVQSLIHAPHTAGAMVALAAPLAVGAIALTTGLGVAAMVKAFGTGFLARSRSAAAEEAREAPVTMLAGLGIAATACVVMAVAPVALTPLLRRVLGDIPAAAGGVSQLRLGPVLRLPGAAGSLAPGVLAGALGVGVVVALAASGWGRRHRPPPRVTSLWACGADGLTPRMQYTATSFAEPLQRVFDDVVRPDTDVNVTHFVESKYLVEQVSYRARLGDAVEDRLYAPIVKAVYVVAGWARRAHTGSVHLYLAYGALGLLVVLVVAR